jgi:hypothetical protein
MTNKKAWIAKAVVLLLSLVLLLSGCGGSGTKQLEQENATLRREKQELEQRVATLEGEVTALQARLDEQSAGITPQPKEGWEQYFPQPETTTLTGESTQAVEALLGRPPVLIRQVASVPTASREIWVYMPFEEDPTGLYLFFKGDRLDSSRLDEFSGLYGSGLLDLEQFWLP